MSISEAKPSALTVRAEWAAEAGVWVAESDDVPGLVTETDTLDRLVERLRVLVPELLELNGVPQRWLGSMHHALERKCALLFDGCHGSELADTPTRTVAP